MSYVNNKFALKTLGSVNYFLSFEVLRNTDGIFLTQTKYTLDLLKKTKMENAKCCTTHMCSSKKLSKTYSRICLISPPCTEAQLVFCSISLSQD